ncbi:MAG: DegV family protein, partial [Pseudomonadota bacterium]
DGLRYCTECMVTGEGIDRRRLRERMSELGDSLVVAGTHNKLKVHIHTDTPDEVFAAAGAFGAVSSTKADDMHRQQEAGHQTARRVAVLTDSAADIPDDELERLHIHTAPLRVHFGERGYLDKLSISSDEFYRRLRTATAYPTTSQPAPGDLRRQFEFLASHFDSVVSLHIGAANSGTFQAAQAAAARSSAAERIHVIDSLNASLGQGLIALHAAECAAAGHDAEAVLAAVAQAIPRTRTFAAVSDMSWGVRGGRIPPAVQTVTDALHLTPVLGTRTSGRVALAGVLFGRRDVEAKFARFVRRRMAADKRYRLAVGYGADRAAGEALLARLLADCDNVEGGWVAQVGSALGTHAGPDVLLAAFQEAVAPPAEAG